MPNHHYYLGYIYEAYDKKLETNVALKIEKKDKNKSILIFEYNVLNMLRGKPQIFVKNNRVDSCLLCV